MFSFFKRKRNKRFNQESHDKAKENQIVSEKKLDLENDEAKVDSEQILHRNMLKRSKKFTWMVEMRFI
ncbi:hypothetical protein [Streptococcus oralis]|uniref:hypothetical protein n=2 Tax=Streptococcus TaxID=1301 RepID=UPI0034A21FF6